MLKRPKSDNGRLRCQRRAVLATLIVATGVPAFAAETSPGSLRIVSPLPLTAPQSIKGFQSNPFCEPAPGPLSNIKIQLASDHQGSPLKMKPIGVAVGLRSIGDPDAPPPPAILISPVNEPQVQTNPMIGSLHRDHAELSDVTITVPAPVVSAPLVEFQSDLAVPNLTTQDATHKTVNEPVVEMIVESMNTDEEKVAKSDAASETIVSEPVVQTESFMFSMSDRKARTSDESKKSVESADSERENSLQEIGPIQIDDDWEPKQASEPVVALANPLFPIDFAEAPIPSLKDAPRNRESGAPVSSNVTSTVKKSGSGVVASLVSSKSRYRPPVAVSSPPLAFMRNESTEGISLVRPAVTRVDAINFANEQPSASGFSSSASNTQSIGAAAPVDLHMSKAQVRTLTIGGSFRRVAVADQAICQAITAGSSELKLIGTGRGVTDLTVWADTGDGKEPKVRVFRIHVDDAVDTTGEAVGDKTETLNQSIARAFPRSRVHIRQEGGQLVVAGDCDSDKSAASILRMVRKTCLIPVLDELRIR